MWSRACSIEATVDRLVRQLGAGPFFLVENVPLENARSRGEPAELVHDSAFGSCDGALIELLEIERATPERVEARWAGSRPRLHHVAYVLPEPVLADLRASLEERGLPEYLSAQLGELDMTFTTPPRPSATTSRSTSTTRAAGVLRAGRRQCRGMGRLGAVTPRAELSGGDVGGRCRRVTAVSAGSWSGPGP
jgi:hypothetical protein